MVSTHKIDRHLPTDKGFQDYYHIFEATSDGLVIYDAKTGRIVMANAAACAMYQYSPEKLQELHSADLIQAESQPLFQDYAQTIQAEGVFQALMVQRRRDGSSFYGEVRATAVTYQQRPCFLSSVRDVSQRIQEEQKLQEQAAAHMREQATLLEISQVLGSALGFQPSLILAQLRLVLEYTHAVLFGLENLTLVSLAVHGSTRLEKAAPFRIQLPDQAAVDSLLTEHRSQRVGDLWSVDPIAHFIRALTDKNNALLLEGIHSWMWIPLVIKGRVIGGVSVAHKQAAVFTAHDAVLALRLANRAAITMLNAQLFEQAQTLITLQERQKLAQDLHDAVNQSLFSAGLIIEVLPRLWERDPEEGRRALEDLRQLTYSAQAEMRVLLAELQPLVLIDTELGELLRQLGNALRGRTNMVVAVTVVGEGRLPAKVQVALYRLCQEAFTNITQHAKAHQVELHLQYKDHGVAIHIRDNGLGFEPELVSAGYHGLALMQERAKSIDATLTILSQPGQGTNIAIQWLGNAESPNAIVPYTPIRVMVVANHTMIRRGLATFLKIFDDLHLVGEANDGKEAIELCGRLLPDVVLIDMVMPGFDAVAAIRAIRQQFPTVQLIALASFHEKALIPNALQAGAVGYLIKDLSAEDLALAIRAAHKGHGEGGTAVTPPEPSLLEETPTLLLATPLLAPGNALTEREQAVLTLMATGLNNTEIAEQLVVSPSTIKTHVSHILAKFGVVSRTEAVALAVRHRLVH